jgi:hypothetical protein
MNSHKNAKVLSGRPSFRPYWVNRSEQKPAIELTELEDLASWCGGCELPDRNRLCQIRASTRRQG